MAEYIPYLMMMATAIIAFAAMLIIAHKRIREAVFDAWVIFLVFLSSIIVSIRTTLKTRREKPPPAP